MAAVPAGAALVSVAPGLRTTRVRLGHQQRPRSARAMSSGFAMRSEPSSVTVSSVPARTSNFNPSAAGLNLLA